MSWIGRPVDRPAASAKDANGKPLPPFAIDNGLRTPPSYPGQGLVRYYSLTGLLFASAVSADAFLRWRSVPGFGAGSSLLQGGWKEWTGNTGKVLVLLAGMNGVKHLLQFTFILNGTLHWQFVLFGGIATNIIEVLMAWAYAARVQAGKTGPQSGWTQYVAIGVMVLGCIGELWTEGARAVWKQKKENKGKIYDGGLFSLVRHPNYLLYSLYRSFGTPLACGLWWAPLAMLAFTLNVYRTDSVPNIENYMGWKYGEKWTEYTKRVRWKVVPFVW